MDEQGETTDPDHPLPCTRAHPGRMRAAMPFCQHDLGNATISTMKEAPLKVTLTEPEIAGDYVVAERNPDGTLLLAPDTSVAAMQERLGLEPMTPEDFEEHFGDLPTDEEG